MMKICPECLERVDDDLEYCPEDGTELREIHAREEDPLEGRILDETWVLESKIGGGGMGTVYRAHQLTVDRTVAVKVLRSDLCEDDEHIERFFREANVASNINDPRCVTIYDFGQTSDDHILYLAMEYLEGESLHERVRRERLSFPETLDVGIQITQALETLHAEGVIHRDLKPENVFLVDDLGEDVSVKLLDFGLAKVARSEATPVTATGQIYGTPEFMSPEQCMGSEIGPASDLYALGCLLYELVAGRTPFESGSSVEVLLAHVNRPAPALDGRAAVPAGYADLIMQLLEKNPDDRPADVVEVRERLQEVLSTIEGEESAQKPAPRLFDVDDDAEVATSETLGADGSLEPLPKVRSPAVETDELDEEDGRSGAPEARSQEGSALPWVLAGALAVLGVAYAAGAFETDAERSTKGERVAASSGAPVGGGSLDVGGTKDAPGEPVVASDDVQPDAPLRRETASDGTDTNADEPVDRGPAPERSARNGRGKGERSGEREEGPLDAQLPVLTKTSASRVFEGKNQAVRKCFMEGLSSDSGLGGSVRVKVLIASSGVVKRSSIAESTVDSDGVESCVRQLVGELSFPPTASGMPAKLMHQYSFEWSELQ